MQNVIEVQKVSQKAECEKTRARIFIEPEDVEDEEGSPEHVESK